jgi:hypothetical protein
MRNPKDGSIWYGLGTFAGKPGFLRFDPKTKCSITARGWSFYKYPGPGFQDFPTTSGEASYYT